MVHEPIQRLDVPSLLALVPSAILAQEAQETFGKGGILDLWIDTSMM